MPAKGLFTAIALLPLFAPSLLSAISFIYIFGNQGFLKSWLMGGVDLWPDRHRAGAGVLLLPARDDDFGHGVARWRMRGSTRWLKRWTRRGGGCSGRSRSPA